LGLIRLAILLIIFLFLLAATYTISVSDRKANLVSIIWLIIIFLIDTKRKDKLFLRLASNHLPLIFFIEYLLLSLPVIVCIILHTHWQSLTLIFAGIICISFINFNWKKQNKTLNTRLQQWIPFDMYEWKAGVRRYFYLIFILWLIGVCTYFFVASIPIVIFVIGLLSFEWYEMNESWQMLLSFEKGTVQLLFHKIKQHFLVYGILVAPLIIIFMVFHFQLWYIPVIEFILFLSIQIYCILVKYAFYSYEGNRSGGRPFMLVGSMIGLIPLCTPLLWLLSIYFFRKAQINLNFYLYDYN
jgi:hypothetical protein